MKVNFTGVVIIQAVSFDLSRTGTFFGRIRLTMLCTFFLFKFFVCVNSMADKKIPTITWNITFVLTHLLPFKGFQLMMIDNHCVE